MEKLDEIRVRQRPLRQLWKNERERGGNGFEFWYE